MEMPSTLPPQENSETNSDNQQPKPLHQMTPGEAAAFWRKLGEEAQEAKRKNEKK